MRLHVQIAGECLTVACQDGDYINTVAHVAVEKLKKLKPTLIACGTDLCECREVRKTIGGSLLDPDDCVGEVLRDGEFILIVLKSDLPTNQNGAGSSPPHPILGTLERRASVSEGNVKMVSFDLPSDYSVTLRSNDQPTEVLVLDGNHLKTSDLTKCEQGHYTLQLSLESEQRISKARALLERIVDEHKIVYGVTTGFGTFANVCIPNEKVYELQENLIRSHAAGIGQPLSPPRARVLLALRINILAKGYSGISLENIRKLVAAFNAFCVSYVPEQGTVGCSGDLCPLAHLALGMIGEGRMWSPTTGWDDAAKVLKAHNLTPMRLGPKEGLALINGTQMVTSLGSLAVERACAIARQADVIAALSLDVLKGTTRAFDADIHKIRPHPGQILTARRLRSLLHSDANPSQIAESHRYCDKVQDAYTLRCVPQVHGIVHDTIDFVRKILTTELNSATDNPLVFVERNETISGGNFHGEYPAKVLDYLAIAVHELAQMSERRLERLLNHTLSGLPTFLTQNGGLNSGFMAIQLCAASLVSENKVLCHPSSVDSIPTSCNQEDHVSMGGFSARKALKVVEHVEAVLAMELLAACQGIEFLKPLMSTAPLQKVYNLVRTVSPALERDRFMQPEIKEVIRLLRQEKVWKVVQPHLQTTEHLEALDPALLRQEASSPSSTSVAPSPAITPGGAETEDIDGPEIKRAKLISI